MEHLYPLHPWGIHAILRRARCHVSKFRVVSWQHHSQEHVALGRREQFRAGNERDFRCAPRCASSCRHRETRMPFGVSARLDQAGSAHSSPQRPDVGGRRLTFTGAFEMANMFRATWEALCRQQIHSSKHAVVCLFWRLHQLHKTCSRAVRAYMVMRQAQTATPVTRTPLNDHPCVDRRALLRIGLLSCAPQVSKRCEHALHHHRIHGAAHTLLIISSAAA